MYFQNDLELFLPKSVKQNPKKMTPQNYNFFFFSPFRSLIFPKDPPTDTPNPSPSHARSSGIRRAGGTTSPLRSLRGFLCSRLRRCRRRCRRGCRCRRRARRISGQRSQNLWPRSWSYQRFTTKVPYRSAGM